MGNTITEKIFSNHCQKNVNAGDIVVAPVDYIMGQDGTAPLAIKGFSEMNPPGIASSKIAFVIDHSSPSPNEGVSALHKIMREFAEENKIKLYDIGEGVCHQLLPERGHIVPGDIVVGADSHTCTYGAINIFSTGVGSTDLAVAMASGKLWFKVPETIKLVINGTLPQGVYAKDLILHLVGEIGADGATYKALEFTGEAIKALNVEERFTISNMAIEMGAKAGLMEFDQKTKSWLDVHANKSYQPVIPDKDAQYQEIRHFDAMNLSPQVACPHTVDNVKPIEQVEGTEIQQCVIGTCTNGRLTDLRVAASIIGRNRIHPKVKLIVAPASKNIFLKAMEEGLIQTLVEAGAAIVTPGCGPCVGTHNGVPANEENVLSTANRNFKGRMGNNKANIYLASPATVAYSAIKGTIADPRNYFKEA